MKFTSIYYEIIKRTYNMILPLSNKELYLVLKEFKRNETLNFDEIDKLALKKTKEIVKHAYNNSSFYREKYSNVGFEPGDFKSWEDFYKLPILEKKEIRNNLNKILINNDYIKVTTGGSTGEPLTLFRDKKNDFLTYALYYRQLRWNNLKIKDKHLAIWRATNDSPNSIENINFFSKLRYSNFILDARQISEEQMNKTLKLIKELKPTYIYSYIGGVAVFADYMLKNNIKPPKSIKIIFSTSSPISQNIREKIEKAFDAKVIDQYGSSEILSLACEKDIPNKLYTFNDSRKIETLENGFQTENNIYGDVVITDFFNYSFPLIRYRNGDRASFFEREPQIGFSSLNPIKGRVSENFILKNNLIVDGSYLTTVFDSISNLVQRFMIIQQSKEKILFIIETKNNNDFNLAVNRINKDMNFLIKKGIFLTFKNDIIRNNYDNGKLRYIKKSNNLDVS